MKYADIEESIDWCKEHLCLTSQSVILSSVFSVLHLIIRDEHHDCLESRIVETCKKSKAVPVLN
jgi:hypothetical protein